jgi:hypothetical protein
MKLHGTIEANLLAAINSSRRLKGHPVHADTLHHWTGVLAEARRELATDEANSSLRDLVLQLEHELAETSDCMKPWDEPRLVYDSGE